jgi:hypothetical protein
LRKKQTKKSQNKTEQKNKEHFCWCKCLADNKRGDTTENAAVGKRTLVCGWLGKSSLRKGYLGCYLNAKEKPHGRIWERTAQEGHVPRTEVLRMGRRLVHWRKRSYLGNWSMKNKEEMRAEHRQGLLEVVLRGWTGRCLSRISWLLGGQWRWGRERR